MPENHTFSSTIIIIITILDLTPSTQARKSYFHPPPSDIHFHPPIRTENLIRRKNPPPSTLKKLNLFIYTDVHTGKKFQWNQLNLSNLEN